jgi:hypothetical protein
MTKQCALRYLMRQDSMTSFIANVVHTGHHNAHKRLVGLALLHQAGHQLSMPSFSLDTLWVDGYSYKWSDLELLQDRLPTRQEFIAMADVLRHYEDYAEYGEYVLQDTIIQVCDHYEGIDVDVIARVCRKHYGYGFWK